MRPPIIPLISAQYKPQAYFRTGDHQPIPEYAEVMSILRNTVNPAHFNPDINLPYQLREDDFRSALQDVYDSFYDVNQHLIVKGLLRLDDILRPAIMSGVLSDMLTSSLATHSRVLVENDYHNGHPDLVMQGVYPDNSVKAGDQGVEVKTTRKKGGAVDTHGARDQWICVFVYKVDNETEPAVSRQPMTFTEVYLGEVTHNDFRRSSRGELDTRSATLHADGLTKLRRNWVYKA